MSALLAAAAAPAWHYAVAFALGAVGLWLWQRMEHDAPDERRVEGMVRFGDPTSNVRLLPRPVLYDQDADRG